jgi:hypothetical protein
MGECSVLDAEQLLGTLEQRLDIDFVPVRRVVGAVSQSRACAAASTPADAVYEVVSQHSGDGGVAARGAHGIGATAGGCAGRATGGVEDGVAAVGGGGLGVAWG